MTRMMMQFFSSLLAAEKTPPPRLRVCDGFANVRVVDQFGRSFRFRDDFVDGRALIINSMYTTCRGSCPTTGATLKKLRVELSKVFGKKLTILSFTLEPEVDTASVLHEFADRLDANKRNDDLCDWHFLTGTPEVIKELRYSLNFYDLNPKVDGDITQHDATLLFGNSTSDRWASLPAGVRHENLSSTIRRVAGFTTEQRFGLAAEGV